MDFSHEWRFVFCCFSFWEVIIFVARVGFVVVGGLRGELGTAFLGELGTERLGELGSERGSVSLIVM